MSDRQDPLSLAGVTVQAHMAHKRGKQVTLLFDCPHPAMAEVLLAEFQKAISTGRLAFDITLSSAMVQEGKG